MGTGTMVTPLLPAYEPESLTDEPQSKCSDYGPGDAVHPELRAEIGPL